MTTISQGMYAVLSKNSRCDDVINNQPVNQALTLNRCSIKINFAMFFAWRILLKRLMWTILIKIFYGPFDKTTQTWFAENDPVIQKLLTYGTVPPLDESISNGDADP
jgi:hypothetical protein